MRTRRLAILLLTGIIAGSASGIGSARAAYYPYDYRHGHHGYYRHGYYHRHYYPPPYYHHHHHYRPPPGYYR